MSEKDPPWIQTISLAPPSLQDNTADADRVLNALKLRLNSEAIHLDLELLRQLPEILRRCKYNVRCVLFKARHRWELVGITSPNDASGINGLAVDLGTTRVVLRLMDYPRTLHSGGQHTRSYKGPNAWDSGKSTRRSTGFSEYRQLFWGRFDCGYFIFGNS
jgi:uncharacterized 2Fe-2S/4Fe-4S cluster protein (DUF4445 family)